MPVKKIKVVDSENESDTKEEIKEQPKEQLKDMIFNFGKYKDMKASDVIQIKQFKGDKIIYLGENYINWCLKNVIFLNNDQKLILQKLLMNFTTTKQ